MKGRWAISVLFLANTIFGIRVNAHPLTVRQVLLQFVPPGEPGAPHNLEWLVEHRAGDGGYYGTRYFPGTLRITKQTDRVILHYKTVETISATGITKTQRVLSGTTHVWNNVLWSAEWKLNARDFTFFLYQNLKRPHTWQVVGQNDAGIQVLHF